GNMVTRSLFSLAFTDGDFVPLPVEILDAEAEPFKQTQARSIKEMADESGRAFEFVEDGTDFGLGEDNRKALRAVGANDAVDAVERAFQDVLVQEEQGAEGLVLRGRGNVAIDREIGEEFVDFRFGHLLRMAFVVEEDETPGPVVIGVFGANGVVANAAGVAEAVEEFGGLDHGFCLGPEGRGVHAY